LEGASHKEVVNDEAWQSDVDLECVECRDTQISCIAAWSLAEPPKAYRPQECLKTKVPKHREILGRAIRHAPHREAFWQSYKSVRTQNWQVWFDQSDLWVPLVRPVWSMFIKYNLDFTIE
jgi:hypothetical protein